jgi:sec-independent protein translocase protein TatA
MNHLLFLDAPELIVIALVFLLLFGGKKIPELMKGLGKGVRSFKEGLNDVENEIKDATKGNPKDSKKDSAKKDE